MLISVAGILPLYWRDRHQSNMAIKNSFGIYMPFHEDRGLICCLNFPRTQKSISTEQMLFNELSSSTFSFILNQCFHTVIFAYIWIPIQFRLREKLLARSNILVSSIVKFLMTNNFALHVITCKCVQCTITTKIFINNWDMKNNCLQLSLSGCFYVFLVPTDFTFESLSLVIKF